MLEGAGAEELGEGRLANAGMACENERWHSFCVPLLVGAGGIRW